MKNQLLHAMRWRYAAKSFDPSRPIAPEAWDALEQSLILTASSYGLQPWKFYVVRDLATREKLRAASWNQRQVTECSHYVVFTRRTGIDTAYVDRFLQATATARKATFESLQGYRKVILGDLENGPRSRQLEEWATRQVYIALGNFLTSAALLAVDTCPMEGIDPEKYDEILGLKNTPYRTVVACAAGHRNPEDKSALWPKVRFERGEMIEEI